MNRFSPFKYSLILLVLTLGILYALPNLYPAQPAIQIAYTDSGKSADQSLLEKVTESLESKSLSFDEIILRGKSARISPARMVLSARPASGRAQLIIASSPLREASINLSSAGLS